MPISNAQKRFLLEGLAVQCPNAAPVLQAIIKLECTQRDADETRLYADELTEAARDVAGVYVDELDAYWRSDFREAAE